MPLNVGDQAPAYKLRSHAGNEVSLDDFKGKKVWLSLYRASPCPLCNLQVSKVKARFEELKTAGMECVSVFESTSEELAQFAGKQATENFPIYVPAEGSNAADFPIYAAYERPRSILGSVYGLVPCYHNCVDCRFPPAFCLFGINPGAGCSLMSPSGFCMLMCGSRVTSMPSDIFIDENGKVVKVYHGSFMGQHIPWIDVEAFAGITSSKPPEGTSMVRDVAISP